MNNLINKGKLLALACFASILMACASTGVNVQDQLLGQWDTEISGFPIVIEYTETTLTAVGFGEPIPYTLEGNVISFEFQGPQIATIEFVSDDEMVQTNSATEQAQTFTRKK